MPNYKSKWVSLPVEFFLLAIVGCLLLFYIARANGTLALVLATIAIACIVYFQYHISEKRINRIRHDDLARCRDAQAMAGVYLRTIESLAIAINAKNQTSHGHVRRTQIYATELGKCFGVSSDELEALKAGALLHDIGKLAVPESILNKPEELTRAESAKLKIHPAVGANILSRVNFPFPVERIVRFQHEKWDGSGFPTGLKDDAIPLGARILAVVDYYDSTRCHRANRIGMTRDESLALLSTMSGSAFDPAIVETFADHLDEFDRLISPQDLNEQVQSENEPIATRVEKAVDNSAITAGDSGFRSITEAHQEVYALHQIAQTIGSSLCLDDTVALVTSKLSTMVPFDTAVIYLVDDKSGQAFPAFTFGEHSTAFSERRINIGDGITGWVIATGQTVTSSIPEFDLLRIPVEIASQIKQALVAPLMREDGSFGAITLYSNSLVPFTTEHVWLIEAVSQYASNALNNALTFEKTKESALVDQLTDLPNARAFYMTLEQRIAESQRLNNRESITIMSIDLDDFKQVNTTHGHATGDSLLRSVAGVIKNQLRQMDVLSRYTGDEFIAILPMASHKTSIHIAERIHTAIKSHKFFVEPEHAIDLGVSIGIASHNEDGETAESLLAVARRNMEHDKHAHKHTPSIITAPVNRIQPFRLP